MEFHPVEDEMINTLLPALFKGAISQIPGRSVNSLPVKQAGITLPSPTQTAGANWKVSCVITGHLIAALHGTAEFRSGDHYLFLGEDRDEIYQRPYEAA